MLNDLALRKKMSGSEPKSSLPGSAVGVGRTGGLRSLSKQVSSQDAVDAAASSSSPTAASTPPNGPATLPRRRHGGLLGPGVTPSPEALSAALDRKLFLFFRLQLLMLLYLSQTHNCEFASSGKIDERSKRNTTE